MIRALLINGSEPHDNELYLFLKENFQDIVIVTENPASEELLKNITTDFIDLILINAEGYSLQNTDSHFSDLIFSAIPVLVVSIKTTHSWKNSSFIMPFRSVGIQGLRTYVDRIMEGRQETISQRSREYFQRIKEKRITKIALPTITKGMRFASPENLVRCEGKGSKTRCYFKNGTSFVVTKPLAWFRKLLLRKEFFEIRNTELVNLKEIGILLTKDEPKVILRNGTSIRTNEKRLESLMQQMNQTA